MKSPRIRIFGLLTELEGPAPSWIVTGLVVGIGVAGVSLLGLVVSLIWRASARRQSQ